MALLLLKSDKDTLLRRLHRLHSKLAMEDKPMPHMPRSVKSTLKMMQWGDIVLHLLNKSEASSHLTTGASKLRLIWPSYKVGLMDSLALIRLPRCEDKNRHSHRPKWDGKRRRRNLTEIPWLVPRTTVRPKVTTLNLKHEICLPNNQTSLQIACKRIKRMIVALHSRTNLGEISNLLEKILRAIKKRPRFHMRMPILQQWQWVRRTRVVLNNKFLLKRTWRAAIMLLLP